MVTRTTRIGVRLTAEVGFRIIQGIHSNGRQATLRGEPLGITACLATDKERYLPKFLLRRGFPDHRAFGHRSVPRRSRGRFRDGCRGGCYGGVRGGLARRRRRRYLDAAQV